jgi:hypothetical protein
MSQQISFDGTNTISKSRSGKTVTSGIAVSHSPDGTLIILRPVNSRGMISPASRIEVPIEKAEAVAEALLAVVRGDDVRSPAENGTQTAVLGYTG